MKPRPITQDDRELWGGVRAVFHCPPSMEDCEPVEVVKDGEYIRIPWQPDEIDVAKLAQGGTVWLAIRGGGMPPVDIQVVAPEAEARHLDVPGGGEVVIVPLLRACLRCGGPLEKKPGPGRWPTYCATCKPELRKATTRKAVANHREQTKRDVVTVLLPKALARQLHRECLADGATLDQLLVKIVKLHLAGVARENSLPRSSGVAQDGRMAWNGLPRGVRGVEG